MRRIAVLFVLVLVACADGEEASDPGCRLWKDEREAPTIEGMAAIAEVADDSEVFEMAVTVGQQIERGEEPGRAADLLDEACA